MCVGGGMEDCGLMRHLSGYTLPKSEDWLQIPRTHRKARCHSTSWYSQGPCEKKWGRDRRIQKLTGQLVWYAWQ